jgi:peptidyl-prolyl cis-trans isomerase B (cyclophilin B)
LNILKQFDFYMKTIFLSLFITIFSFATFANGGTNNSKNTTKENTINIKMDTSKYIIISTDLGDIKIRLYDETPLHRDNFLKLAQEGFLDSTLFHRVISEFMLQGGDPDSKNAQPGQRLGMGSNGYRVPAEFNKNLIHKKGALAAARDNNPAKASSGCQFYLVQGKTYTPHELAVLAQRTGNNWTAEQLKTYETIGGAPFLDMNYTVFGEVVSGLDVIDKIAAEAKDANDRPYKDIRMKVKVVE